jgi:hypothetical protein
MLANILYVKLVPHAAEVVRESKEAVDQIVTMRQILENVENGI